MMHVPDDGLSAGRDVDGFMDMNDLYNLLSRIPHLGERLGLGGKRTRTLVGQFGALPDVFRVLKLRRSLRHGHGHCVDREHLAEERGFDLIARCTSVQEGKPGLQSRSGLCGITVVSEVQEVGY
ncbi:hypothetical protein [Phenylobacterium sp.]|uniref:hypothetical protein n=1 Tax=Phenylobacterium sp. TaxID=1871053 RepID=UPI00286B667E|nr:hypothetical protein [Phenylobacterium sp.]